MTQWILHERKQEKKKSVKRMTQEPDSLPPDENGEDNTEVEDESDAGSDIFMPGGITMKATDDEENEDGHEKDNEDGQEKDNADTSADKSVVIAEEDLSKDVKSPESDLYDANKEQKNTDRDNLIEVNKTGSPKIAKPIKTPDSDEDNEKLSESVDSPSSCLEMNLEDDAAFPRSNKEKNINSVHRQNHIFEERNIFTNISDILETEEKVNEHEGTVCSETKDIQSKKASESGDEHNMSDDFKIGLKQKSYDEDPFCPAQPLHYEVVVTNVYLIDKKKSRSSKEDRYMQCECPFEPDDPCFVGCDDDCLNRLLLIECSPRTCPTGEFCTNRSFQRGCVYDLEIFKAGQKGWGLKTNEEIPKGAFVMEYCGEVVDYNDFQNRTQDYHNEGISHYYFMTLKQNEIIDATKKGSKSRFINHSCDPNCETQKWTVNGFLRVGFFAVHHIDAGEELSFDYQFQRYGEKPQDCFCGADLCRGVIGSEQVSTVPSYFEKIMADSPSQVEKKKKKGKQPYNSELAEELNEFFGRNWELTDSKHTLELLRLMVKVGTIQERIVLMKILQVSRSGGAMKAFVRYKGLSLLWSWMVDVPDHKLKYKIEILKTLKNIPVPTRNELDDSKVESIVQKWSTPTSSNESDESAKPKRHNSLDDTSNTPSGSDNDGKNDDGGTSSQDESSKEDNEESAIDKLNKTSESMEEGEILEDTENESKKKKKKKHKDEKKIENVTRREEKISALSNALIDEWKLLKEVFRIPKKSQTPDRRPKVDSDCPSPQQPLDEKRNASLPKVSSSNAPFSSPPAATRQTIDPSKGLTTPTARTVEEPSEPSSTDNPSSNVEDANGSSPARDFRSSRKREWRKSPDNRGNDSFSSRDSNQHDNDDSRRFDDNSRSDRRESRWDRDRRNSYDRDRRSNWNNDYDVDNDNSGDNDHTRGSRGSNQNRWNRNRNWNERNNRGNNRMPNNNRDNRMNHNNEEQRMGNETAWNGGGGGVSHWGAPQAHQQQQIPQQQIPQPPPQPPQPPGGMHMQQQQRFRDPRLIPSLMNNELQQQQQQQPPRPPAGFPTIMGQNQPPNMLGQHSMNMLSQVPRPPNMLPPQQMQSINPLNVVLPNQVNQNSPLISPMTNQQFNPGPIQSNINPPQPPFQTPSTAGQFNATPDVTTLNVVNQLLLLNAERLKQATGGGSHTSTPDNGNRNPSAPASPHRTSSVSSPTRSKPLPTLPAHWKTATDADGRVYYYHTLTRETSWDAPVGHISSNDNISPKRLKKIVGRGSVDVVVHSPSIKQSPRIVAADTTHKSGPRTPPSSTRSSSSTNTNDLQKIREAFKSKISSVVVNCLNVYQKVDCKQGRIKSVDDFKFLARKLTHGLIMKERQRIGNEDKLHCNDSVKVKVKEYIRNYMKKFGAVYIRS